MTRTDQLVIAIAGCKTREAAAKAYSRYLHNHGGEPSTDADIAWSAVNGIIMSRWSVYGLKYIKNLAWKYAAE